MRSRVHIVPCWKAFINCETITRPDSGLIPAINDAADNASSTLNRLKSVTCNKATHSHVGQIVHCAMVTCWKAFADLWLEILKSFRQYNCGYITRPSPELVAATEAAADEISIILDRLECATYAKM